MPPPMANALEPDHVLIARPPDVVRQLLATDLADAGFHVSTADGCREGAEIMERDAPAVVLVDMALRAPHPRYLFAIASALRPETRFVALTPFGHDREVAEAIELGAFCCLQLPVSADELVRTVRVAGTSALQVRHTGLARGRAPLPSVRGGTSG